MNQDTDQEIQRAVDEIFEEIEPPLLDEVAVQRMTKIRKETNPARTDETMTLTSYTIYLRERHSGRDRKNAGEALSLLRAATGVEPFVVRGLGAEDELAKRLARPVHSLHFPQVFHETNYIGGLGPLKKHLLTQGPRERKAVADFNRIKRLKKRANESAAMKDVEELCGAFAEKKATRYGQIRDAACRRAANAAAMEENAKAELADLTLRTEQRSR